MKDELLQLEQYSLHIIRSSRKSVMISVTGVNKVIVRAPFYTTKQRILDLLQEKEDWLSKHFHYFKFHKHTPSKIEYNHGSKHFFLGIHCLLDCNSTKSKMGAKIHYADGKLYINHPRLNNAKIQGLLHQFYRQTANEMFTSKMKELFIPFAEKGYSFPILKIRKMKSRWGSYSSRHHVTLNLELIKTDPECIDYVIMHELCHMIHQNHSTAFYALLSEMMPDWRDRKKKLNRFWTSGL